MTLGEKLNYVQTNFMGIWLNKRGEVLDKLSSQNTPMCICGRLATGFHESCCRRFQNKVNSETLKELKHLFKKIKLEAGK